MRVVYVSAALIFRTEPDGTKRVFATERGYGQWRGWWEFPGGKIEAGESAQSALVREIREELASEVRVKNPLFTIDYDYLDFHLHMQCFDCEVVSGRLELLEHKSAAWLCADNLRSVRWLPADEQILPDLERILRGEQKAD